ncbi:hypothetical protein SAMN06265371_10183 [Lutibacter agarilyticus]|uniref:PKD domain-containing protein n=1 Tax=Lutibacter agarilyticus TaxID=1109740 RepID=A0A238V959_9FLAO|nr:hypothetical protein [Lutibacter agarilyticus]SNR30950.1 hypothetical protein SAMN06265371_10183 [Lutibacter agarilyticus]
MNLKKIKTYIWFIAVALFINACSDDSNELSLTEPNHRVVYTSQMDFENKININGEIDFGDISAGVESRTWTFPEGVVDIVGSDDDINSSKDVVKTIFNTVGEHSVHLNQIFKGDAFVGTELRGKELDTTIIVTVLSPVTATINANFINDDGSLGAALNIADMAENEVTASKSVRFTYATDGAPEEFVWNFDGGDPTEVTAAPIETDVKYKKMGTYDIQFIASRARPYGGDTIYLKDFIKVIASTDPVDLEQVTDKDGDIALVFSREMDASTLNKDNFSIIIENGGVITPTIKKASVDATEGNIILLELDGEGIYNDDVIKVSYTPGVLATLDAVKATAFTDEILEFTKINILDVASDYDHSFENSTADNWPYMWWGGVWGEYDLEISDIKAQDGSKSAYIEFRPNGGMIIGHKNTAGDQITFPAETGKNYEIGIWVYVEDLGANDPAGFAPDVRFFWWPDTNWGVGGNPTFTSDFKTGEWVYSKTYAQFNETGDKTFQIRGYNEANPERLKFYMDNLSVSEVSLRP